jgi:hypothetical protein
LFSPQRFIEMTNFVDEFLGWQATLICQFFKCVRLMDRCAGSLDERICGKRAQSARTFPDGVIEDRKR